MSAISNTIHTPLVTTTWIVAKLVVGAVLIAGATCAQAGEAIVNQQPSPAKLADLDRGWKKLHSRRQHAALHRLVACREYGWCEGLNIPTLDAAVVRAASVDP